MAVSGPTYFGEDADYIEAMWKVEDRYGEQVGNNLTVFRSVATKEIIGVQISGIRAIMSAPLPGVSAAEIAKAIGAEIVSDAETPTSKAIEDLRAFAKGRTLGMPIREAINEGRR